MRAKPDDSTPALLAFLESAEAEDVTMAADYIAKYRLDGSAEPLLAALIRSPAQNTPGVYYQPNTGPRVRLLNALRALEVEDRAGAWLDGGGPPVAHVITLAIELKMTGLAPKIADRLDDEDPQVRRQAAGAVAALGYADAADRLRARLKDEHAGVRADALRAIGALDGDAATRTVLDHLLGGDADLQAAAVELLPRMDLDVAIDALTTPENLDRYIVRYAIASLVASTDRSVLHRVMARAGERLKTEDLNEMIRLIQMTRTR